MNENSSHLSSMRPAFLVLLVVSVFLLFFLDLDGYDLSAPDEPRFALVAREMIQNGHWLLPHRNDRAYPDKPPLFFWSIALVSLLQGGTVDAFSARLPSALAAALILLALYFWIGPRTREQRFQAEITLMVLMVSVRFFLQAHMAQIDMLLCLFTTMALILGFNHFHTDRNRQFWIGTCMGLAILTKGPVGYLIPAGSFLVYAWMLGKGGRRRYPTKALLWGLVPPLLWLGALVAEVAVTHQWDYFYDLVFRQTLVRYLNPWHHYKPFYYFLQVILYDFFPWSPLLLLALPTSLKRLRALEEKEKFAWAVILFTLVFFSLSKGKRNLYILPLYPFAAHVVGVRLAQALQAGRFSPSNRLGLGVVALALAAFSLGLVLVTGGFVAVAIPEGLPVLPTRAFMGMGIVLLILALVFVLGLTCNLVKTSLVAAVLSMFYINIFFFQMVMPWVDPYRSPRTFVERATALMETQSTEPIPLAMVDYRSAYRFYGTYPIDELKTAEEAPNPDLPSPAQWFADHPNGWLIIREPDLHQLEPSLQKNLVVHYRKKVGRGTSMLLVRPRDSAVPQ